MIDPTEYVVSEDDVLFDVDMDTEVVRLMDGRRLTNELAEETLADARRRNLVPGRKSPSGGGVHSTAGSVPVPDSLRAAAEQRADEKA